MTGTDNTAQPTASVDLWVPPVLRPRGRGEVACGACGVGVPVAQAGPVDRVRLAEIPGLVDDNGFVRGRVPIADAAFGRCGDCARRRELWGAWARKPSNTRGLTGAAGLEDAAVEVAERLAAAITVLHLDGAPSRELLDAAGLNSAAHEHPVTVVRFADYIAAEAAVLGVEDRAALTELGTYCAVKPWSHITVEIAGLLNARRRRHLDLAAHAGETARFTAADAARVMLPAQPTGSPQSDTALAYVVDSGCGACGCSAFAAPYGTPVEELWTPVTASMRALTGRLRRAGSRVGSVALLLCNGCLWPFEDDNLPVGDSLASSLLSAVYGDELAMHYEDAAGHLHAARVVRARLLGRVEPTPSAAPWDHLPRDPETGEIVRAAPVDWDRINRLNERHEAPVIDPTAQLADAIERLGAEAVRELITRISPAPAPAADPVKVAQIALKKGRARAFEEMAAAATAQTPEEPVTAAELRAMVKVTKPDALDAMAAHNRRVMKAENDRDGRPRGGSMRI